MPYFISSHNFTGGEFGSLISDKELEGCNVAALIEGGHLTPEPVKKSAHPTKSDEDKEKQ